MTDVHTDGRAPRTGIPLSPGICGPATGYLDAAVFDMDGVVTDTARVHRAAWKQMFDDWLRRQAECAGSPYVEFTDDDYRTYVDGRPREDGVDAFLRRAAYGCRGEGRATRRTATRWWVWAGARTPTSWSGSTRRGCER